KGESNDSSDKSRSFPQVGNGAQTLATTEVNKVEAETAEDGVVTEARKDPETAPAAGNHKAHWQPLGPELPAIPIPEYIRRAPQSPTVEKAEDATNNEEKLKGETKPLEAEQPVHHDSDPEYFQDAIDTTKEHSKNGLLKVDDDSDE